METLNLFETTSETQKGIVNRALRKQVPPQDPGVYTMYDRNDGVLYVGKAKDLQKRIYSYRYSKSKKVQQMLAHLWRIGFERCASETDALLLENLLIRSIRPPYNTVNKQPETYYYISTARSGNKKEFRLSMKPLHDYSRCYGCFKGHNRVRRGLGALLKFLYIMENDIRNAHFLPAQLVSRTTPMRFRINLADETGVWVHHLLSGTSNQFVEECINFLEKAHFEDLFTSRYFEKELEQLRSFYSMGPERNHHIKTVLGLDYHIIPQNEIDDLQTLYFKTIANGG